MTVYNSAGDQISRLDPVSTEDLVNLQADGNLKFTQQTKIVGTDAALLTADVPVALTDAYMTLSLVDYDNALALDTKVFDKTDCKILSIISEDVTAGYASDPNAVLGAAADGANYLTLQYCGKKSGDANDLAVTDNTTDITLTFDHGLPVNLEQGTLYLADGPYRGSGAGDTSIVAYDILASDATSVDIDVTAAQWAIDLATFVTPSLYFPCAVIENGGGTDYSGEALTIVWATDPSYPTFWHSVLEDA